MASKKINFAAGHANKVAAGNRSSQTRVDAAQMFVRLADGNFIDLYDALEQLNDDLASEASDRAAGDAALQVNIDAEAVSRVAGDSSLEAALAAEATARVAADTTLQANIDAEAASRDAGDLAEAHAAQMFHYGTDYNQVGTAPVAISMVGVFGGKDIVFGSEMVIINGLIGERDVDYTVAIDAITGLITGITLENASNAGVATVGEGIHRVVVRGLGN